MPSDNKRITGVRRKLQQQENFKTYYEKNKDRLSKRSLQYYHENKDNESYAERMDKKAYQQWYYENVRKTRQQPSKRKVYKRKDSEFNKKKADIVDELTFKVVFNRNPDELVLTL